MSSPLFLEPAAAPCSHLSGSALRWGCSATENQLLVVRRQEAQCQANGKNYTADSEVLWEGVTVLRKILSYTEGGFIITSYFGQLVCYLN